MGRARPVFAGQGVGGGESADTPDSVANAGAFAGGHPSRPAVSPRLFPPTPGCRPAGSTPPVCALSPRVHPLTLPRSGDGWTGMAGPPPPTRLPRNRLARPGFTMALTARGVREVQLTAGGLERRARVYVPRHAGAHAPLVLVLHGGF